MGRKHFKSSDICDVVAANIKKFRKDAGLTQIKDGNINIKLINKD